jgi:hypothetical protein
MPQAPRGAKSTVPAVPAFLVFLVFLASLADALAQETRVVRCEKTAHMLVTREKLF